MLKLYINNIINIKNFQKIASNLEDLFVMTAVDRYLSIQGQVVWIAFRYCFWYKNRSIISSLPLGWLKKTKRDQWMSQVLCCRVCRAEPNTLSSINCRRRLKSSRAVSQFCMRISDASLPHIPLR